MVRISELPSSIHEAVDSYRRSLEFGNQLLVEDFVKRENFKTGEAARKAGQRGISPAVIDKYIARRDAMLLTKTERYEKKLSAKVTAQVRRYEAGLHAGFKM